MFILLLLYSIFQAPELPDKFCFLLFLQYYCVYYYIFIIIQSIMFALHLMKA